MTTLDGRIIIIAAGILAFGFIAGCFLIGVAIDLHGRGKK